VVSGGSRVKEFYRVLGHNVHLFESFIAGRAVYASGDLPSCAGWEVSCPNHSSPEMSVLVTGDDDFQCEKLKRGVSFLILAHVEGNFEGCWVLC
jgi:hypothetical protein